MKLYPIPKWAIEMVEEGSERVMMIFLSVIAILVILIGNSPENHPASAGGSSH